jgi:hypothetical protein
MTRKSLLICAWMLDNHRISLEDTAPGIRGSNAEIGASCYFKLHAASGKYLLQGRFQCSIPFWEIFSR